MSTPIKSISAVKPKRPSGQTRAKNKRGGENVRWKRFTSTISEAINEAKRLPPDKIDQAVALMAACAKLTAPVSRLVYFKHLTTKQGMAARRYASIVSHFERYHVANATRSARAQDIDRQRAGEDQEIQRRIQNDTIREYERDARKARKEYDKAQKVLARYSDSVTGRNEAKNVLDDLCLSDIEPPAQYRQNIAAVLEALANEFGIEVRG